MHQEKARAPDPNSAVLPKGKADDSYGLGSKHPYIATLIHGSLAQVSIAKAEARLAELTKEAEESNRENAHPPEIHFASGSNPIRHVIYIIKENRSYDQVFGDLKEANSDPSLCLYCEDITPNQHELARQFGILDNFYVSGEVSGKRSCVVHGSDRQRLHREDVGDRLPRLGAHLYDYEGGHYAATPSAKDFPTLMIPVPATSGVTWRARISPTATTANSWSANGAMN